MARSPLFDTITRVQGTIVYVRENLSNDEFNLFLDLLVPETPEVKTVKRGRKKGGKSAKAESLSSVIAKTPRADAGAGLPCAHILPDNNHCMELKDNPVHDPNGGYVLSHIYVAPSARKRSSTKGAETVSTVNSETEKAVALAVAGSSNEQH